MNLTQSLRKFFTDEWIKLYKHAIISTSFKADESDTFFCHLAKHEINRFEGVISIKIKNFISWIKHLKNQKIHSYK